MTDSTTDTLRPGRALTVEQLLAELTAQQERAEELLKPVPPPSREEQIAFMGDLLEPMPATPEERTAAREEAERYVDSRIKLSADLEREAAERRKENPWYPRVGPPPEPGTEPEPTSAKRSRSKR